MNALGWLAIVLLVFLVYAVVQRRFVRGNLLERQGDDVRLVEIQPAGYVTLHRYPAGEKKFSDAVVLCHGLGANRFNFDLDDETSLVRFLCGRGFEVWSVELRHCGLSKGSEGRFADHGGTAFEDLLDVDVRVALEWLNQHHPGFFWVGHSLGGMLGMAWAGLRRTPFLRGVVAIGSPLWPAEAVKLHGAARLVRLATLLPVVHFRSLARALFPITGRRPRFYTRAMTTGEQMDRKRLGKAVVNLVENVSSSLLEQLWNWKQTASFSSRDGNHDYFEALSRIEEPVLLLAGEADLVAPPASIFPGYEKLKVEDRQLRIFGVDRGDEHDYAHGDLLLGQHAPKEVFPALAEWLETRARHN